MAIPLILQGVTSVVPLIFTKLVLVTVFVPVGMAGLVVLIIACIIVHNALARNFAQPEPGAPS